MATNVVLTSSDEQKFEIDIESAKQSELLKGLIDNSKPDQTISIIDVKSDTLKKIVEYLTHYKGVEPKSIPKPLPSSNLSDSLDEWDINFINGIEPDNLYDLINGANYMTINSLIDLACAKIASLMKDKTVEEMRTMLNTECDLSEEELKQLEGLKL